MAKRQLTTVKQVLTRMKYLVNTKGTGKHGHFYLCCIPPDLRIIGLINIELQRKVVIYLEEQKPTKTMNLDFYNHRHYNKYSVVESGWWNMHITRKTIIKEKIRFLKHIINKL